MTCSMFTTMALGLMKMELGYAVGNAGSRIIRSRNGTPSSRCISIFVASKTAVSPAAFIISHARLSEYSFAGGGGRVSLPIGGALMRDPPFAALPLSDSRGSSSRSGSSRDQMIAFGPEVYAPRAPRASRRVSTCGGGKRAAPAPSVVPGVPAGVPGVAGLPDRGDDTEAMATPREFPRRSRSGAARSSSARSSSVSPPRRPRGRK